MIPNAGEGGVGSQPMSTVQLHTGAQINFGYLAPYLFYAADSVYVKLQKDKQYITYTHIKHRMVEWV